MTPNRAEKAAAAVSTDEIDWSLTTWKGSRLEQHRAFLALPFRRKLELIEEMCDHARYMAEGRRLRGLPYFDPLTRELVPGKPSGEKQKH